MNIPQPKFDVWFWLLVLWSIFVPFWFDEGHVASCIERGVVTFAPYDVLWSDKPTTFACTPIKEVR
jgi:hypothetical protein